MFDEILNVGYYIFAIYLIITMLYLLAKNKFKFNEIIKTILFINILIEIKYSNVVSIVIVITCLFYITISSLVKVFKKKSINSNK